jgi:hypothetical protein
MNEPLTMIIKNTKIKLANVCNESGLPPVILDLIVQGIYSEIHLLAEKQTSEEEKTYINALEESKDKY